MEQELEKRATDTKKLRNMGLLLILALLIVILIITGVVFLGRGASPEISSEESVNGVQTTKEEFDKAPDFTLEDFEGNEISLSDFSGKIRVVNSWATWCPFCVDELPDFAQLQKEFGEQVVVIAVGRAESLEKAKGYTDDLGVTEGFLFLLDPSDSFYKSIGGFSMPETLFVDGEGNIRIHKRGPMRFTEMKERVESILVVTNNSGE